MNRKNIFLIIISILIFVILAAAGFWFFVFNKEAIGQPIAILENSENQSTESSQEETSQTHKMVTDDFSVDLPAEWVQTQATSENLAIIAKSGEDIENTQAKEINFTSYIAISKDTFSGSNLSEYMQTVKDAMAQSISGVSFSRENSFVINGKDAYAMDAQMSQRGVNFKVLLVAIRGNENDIWFLSFNTTENKWDEYVGDFSSIAQSFIVKI